jgi:hypothetical protein
MRIQRDRSEIVHLTLDLSRVKKSNGKRDFAITVVPQMSNSVAAGTSWKLTGCVRPMFEFTPALVDFGEPMIRGKSFQPKLITARSTLPLHDITVNCKPPLFDVTCTVSTPGNRCSMQDY